jgi:hypothetical protein
MGSSAILYELNKAASYKNAGPVARIPKDGMGHIAMQHQRLSFPVSHCMINAFSIVSTFDSNLNGLSLNESRD